jgi:hypothetical protein
MQEHSQCGGRHGYRIGLFAVVEELDANAGSPAKFVGGQAAAGFARKLGIGLGRCKRREALL